MLGGDGNDDFPVVNTSSKSKLAKLFETEPEEDVSLKYTPPKETKMKTQAGKSHPSTVHLRVFMGKTVEAFKMENGRYKMFGKVGAAVLGNEEQGHFQLYVYRNDERKVTSADISSVFKFSIHENNYAIFHDRVGDAWSLHFEKSTDLADFSRQIILAKWRSSDCKSRKLIQDIVYGEKDKTVGNGDRVVAVYRVIPITGDKQLCPELPKRILTYNSDSDLWEVSLTGALQNSCRAIILSHDNLGDWRTVVPKGCCLMLELEIQQIICQNSNEQLEHLTNTMRNRPEKVADPSSKQSLVSRMAKMGQSLIPFPNFPSNLESNSANNEIDHSMKLPDVKMAETEMAFSDSKKQEFHPHTQTGCKMPDNSSDFLLRQSMEGEIHSFPRDMISVTSQFNVLFSEIRTSNAELRMNLTRISDRVDAVVNKVDTATENTNNKFENIQKQLDKILDNNTKMHSQIIENLELLSGFCEKNLQPISLQTDPVDNFEIMELKTRNNALEECLQAANASSCALQVKVQELKNHIEMNEKQTELMQQLQESEKRGSHQCEQCKCHVDERMKNLETCVETLETRNCNLEMLKVELENKVAHLDAELSDLYKLKKDAGIKLNEVKSEYENKIISLENELQIIKSEHDTALKRLVTDKEIFGLCEPSLDVTDIVKKLMNMTYKSLKLQLIKDDNDLTRSLQKSLVYTLRMVTNSYLAQYGDAVKTVSVDSGSPKDLATNPSLLSKSLGSDHLPLSNSNSSVSPSSKSDALSSRSNNEMGNPNSFSPSDSPLPSPPNQESGSKAVTSDLSSFGKNSEKPVSSVKTRLSDGSDYSVTPNLSKNVDDDQPVDYPKQVSSITVTSQSSSVNSSDDRGSKSETQSSTHVCSDHVSHSVLSENTVSPSSTDYSKIHMRIHSSCSDTDPSIDKVRVPEKRSESVSHKPSVHTETFLNENTNYSAAVDTSIFKCLDKEINSFKSGSDVKPPETIIGPKSDGAEITSHSEFLNKSESDNKTDNCIVTGCVNSKSKSEYLEAIDASEVNNINSDSDITSNNTKINNNSSPFVFAPLISSEPPPFTITPSPSPPNSPSSGSFINRNAVLKSDEPKQVIEKSENSKEAWRPQPPPLFLDDDDEDDDIEEWMGR